MKEFEMRCLELLKQIPKGKITTYKAIAKQLNSKAYRAVGNAMNKNPHNIKSYPCHRVVKSDFSIGNYNRGIKKKIELLKNEGIEIDEKNEKILKKKKVFFNFEQF